MVAEAFDRLFDAWQRNPGPENAIALCRALGGSTETDTVQRVGREATARHPDRPDVLLAAGRMYLSSALLADAQLILVSAGKLAPKSPEVYRWLGEVLLRRGDASRAEKVLERALALGRTDQHTRFWHSRARSLISIQRYRGEQVVAEQVARALENDPLAEEDDEAGLGPDLDEDDATVVRHVTEFEQQAIALDGVEELDDFDELQGSELEDEDQLYDPSAHESGGDTEDDTVQWRADGANVVGGGDEQGHATGRVQSWPPSGAALPRPSGLPPLGSALPPLGSALPPLGSALPPPPRRAGGISALPPSPTRQPTMLGLPPPPSVPPTPSAHPPLGSSLPPPPSRPPRESPMRARAGAPVPPPPVPPPPLTRSVAPASHAAAPPARSGAPAPLRSSVPPFAMVGSPSPNPFLSASAAGQAPASISPSAPPRPVFELEDEPARKRGGRGWRILTVLLLLGVAGGGFGYWRRGQLRTERASQAMQLDLEVAKLLRSGRPADFASAESKLSRAFDLAPAQPLTALSWVKDRVLRGLWLDPSTPGVETAITRAEQSGVASSDLAFARAGAALIQGRTSQVPSLLGATGTRDAYAHFVAGMALERAGDERALGELDAATHAEPEFFPPRVLAAASLLLRGSPEAGEAVQVARRRLGDGADTAALGALAWAVDPRTPPPGDVPTAETRRAELPAPLRFVPDLLEAITAAKRGDFTSARGSLGRSAAAARTTGPDVFALIGRTAAGARDEKLVRDMAARVKGRDDPASTTLTALAALLEGRLDDAVKAAGRLAGKPDDAVGLRAAAGYERLDPAPLAEAARGKGSPWFDEALAVLRGSELDAARIQDLNTPFGAPLGECFAVDAALDAGDLKLAKTITDGWAGADESPAHAVRVARVLRYGNDPAAADAALSSALRDNPPTPRAVLERTLILVQAGRAQEAGAWLAKNGAPLGAFARWAAMYIDASSGRIAEARRAARKLGPVASTAPLPFRVLSALALSAIGDKKNAETALKQLAKTVPHHPDLVRAAASLRVPSPRSSTHRHR